MSELREKCIDIAEFYDIDWYNGPYRYLFNDHEFADIIYQRLFHTHQANIVGQKTWEQGRDEVFKAIESIGRSLGHDASTNIAWLGSQNEDMSLAIQQAQKNIAQFTKAISTERSHAKSYPEHAVVKAFFSLPDNPSVGEHMFVNEVKFINESIQGNLASDPSLNLGVTCGELVVIPLDRISDWFYVLNGVAHGGYTLPVIAKHLTENELADAKLHPPFKWFPNLIAGRTRQ